MKLVDILNKRIILIESENSNKKSINDEFIINDFMLNNIKKILEKTNKKLKSRNLPELELKILKSENIHYRKDLSTGLSSEMYVMPVHTIKIIGDVPEIKDYEFIAKIEHGDDGNILNMVPNSSIEKLPDIYKTFNQKCDICHTNRERNNTFIIKKINDTGIDDGFKVGQLIVAGSSCLKKFMPLDVVKGFLYYAVILETMRNVLAEYEEEYYEYEETGGGRRVRQSIMYDPDNIMTLICTSYYDNHEFYISQTKAQESDKISTLSHALTLLYNSEDNRDKDLQQKACDVIDKYKDKASSLSDKVLTWSHDFDFDEAAQKNPKMDSYFHNLKILINRSYVEGKHLGYFASLLGLYLRENSISTKKDITKYEYYGNIGDKIINIPVSIIRKTGYDTTYGYMTIYLMKHENNMFVYKGKDYGFDEGNNILLSGTIKDHKIYNNVPQTIITRPKMMENN